MRNWPLFRKCSIKNAFFLYLGPSLQYSIGSTQEELPGILLTANNRKYDTKLLTQRDVCHMEQTWGTSSLAPLHHRGSGSPHISFPLSPECRLLASCMLPHGCELALTAPDMASHFREKKKGEERKQKKSPISQMTSIYVSWPEMYHRASPDPWESGRASVLSWTYCYPNKIKFSLLRRKRECLLGRQLAISDMLVQIFIFSSLRD